MRITKPAVVVVAFLVWSVPALAKTFKVGEYKKSGIYEQEIGDFRYLHDTVTGLCFFMYTDGSTAAGLTSVDCNSVTKRPEWFKSLSTPVPEAEPEVAPAIEPEAATGPEAAKPKKRK
ncbi:MAG: hypothetical protein HYY44_01065 [Deltaproteobacteria bacterium]|nr:hypothetical protein [Deltaproteobacteria bacterium]MBI4373872.1 hypothetical protein [Deltaproteobacteria bacterium]